MADTEQPEYIAHVRKSAGGGALHGLKDHLAAVAGLAGDFAATFGARDIAELAGRWHDLGKFRPGFQRSIAACGHENAHLETRVTSRDKTHALFDRPTVERCGDDVARGFDAYSALFDGQPVAVGEHKIADRPNVTLIRRC